MEGCHNNGNCTDDRLENLRWDTHSSNLLDRRQHGTNVQGEMVNTAKLTKDDVILIRQMGGEGIPRKAIALRFHITETMMGLIVRRRNWTHVA